jgi:hypothetical protein
MNNVSLDALRGEPTRQPEAVGSGLERDGDTCDPAALFLGQRFNRFSNACSSIASFFSGWRSTPGTMPATSQLDWLISITAITVASISSGSRHRLKSFTVLVWDFVMMGLHRVDQCSDGYMLPAAAP